MKRVFVFLFILLLISPTAFAKKEWHILTGPKFSPVDPAQVQVSFFYQIRYNGCAQIGILDNKYEEQERYDHLKKQAAGLGATDILVNFDRIIALRCKI